MTCGFVPSAERMSDSCNELMSRQHQGEVGTLQRPSALESNCLRGRFARLQTAPPMRKKRSASLAALATIIVMLAAACGGEPEQTAIEREVQNYLQSVVAPAEISDIDCPPDAPIRPGSSFLCDGLVENEFYEAQVTIIDAQGRKEIRPRHAVMQVIAKETSVAAEAAEALGFDVQADCGDSLYLVVPVGQTFLCTLEQADTGLTQDIEVKVQNEIGATDWKLKGS